MQQQCTLVERPVILSQNKRNVIPHGRPLSPIGTVRSVRPFFAPKQIKASFAEEKHGDTLSHKSFSSIAPSSTSLIDYQKSVNENLMTINNNLSVMLKESFAGIDSICQKVRLCLMDANYVTKPEIKELSIIEKLEKSKENLQALSISEEEAFTDFSNDDIPNMTEDQDVTMAEIIEECADDEEMENEKEKRKENKSVKKTKRTKSITPFFTILNPNTQSAESVGVAVIKSKSSKLDISRKRTAENFQKKMREVEKLTDYEQFLTSMVEGINKEIDLCYAKYPRMEGQTRSDNDKKGSEKKKDDDKKESNASTHCNNRKNKNDFHISEELKRIGEIGKIHRDLMEDQFSENDLTSRYTRRQAFSLNFATMDFTYPDVYRKRAITDLHRRLEAQVEANDSLIFFQKLMAKNQKHMIQNRPNSDGCNENDKQTGSTFKSPMHFMLSSKCNTGGLSTEKKQRSLTDLVKKYQDSLWFRQRKRELRRNKNEGPQKKRKGKKSAGKKDKKIVPISYTIENSPSDGNKLSKSSSLKEPSQVSVCNCKMKVTNDQPLSEAHKCKLHWMRAKYSQLSHKKLKYLDILDDITKNDLLPIKAEYPRRDEIKCTLQVKDSYLYKLTHEENKETQNAWEQLFEPSTKCSQGNCQKCSSTTNKENHSKKDNNQNQNMKKPVYPEQLQPSCQLEKGDVIRKLSKYIFFETPGPKFPKRVFTVMPVHVFYDNVKTLADNKKHMEMPQKLPLLPMRETKEFVKKAEWNDGAKRAKPMRVVYDPILRKIEKEIRMVTARPENKGTSKIGQTSSWSPKNFTRFCSPQRQPNVPRIVSVKIDTIDKTSPKAKKTFGSSNRIPQISELFKRSPKPSLEKVSPHPSVPPLWTPPFLDEYPRDKERDVRQKIKNTISSEANARVKNEKQRKIWEHKYGKSAGQKLLNFIEKQPSQYQTPVPKHALPKTAKDPTRQQAMLEQLRFLKQKNDNIQTNIQKAIEVIENKMVDILSRPTTSESIEAFDAMEKEITNVLSLMKSPNSLKNATKKEKSEKTNEYENENNLSDELFRRLDRILESPGMSASGRSSKTSLTKEERTKLKNKLITNSPPKSTDMNQVCFSSTSASGEEKFTITAISPKRSFKSPTRTPFVRPTVDPVNITNMEDVSEDVSAITTALRRLENELKIQKSSEEINPPNTANISEMVEDTEPVKEPIKISSILKKRKIVPEQEQVVNIAIFHQKVEQGSAGDQLQQLKQLLENDLKSMETSDEKTYSVGVPFSQGDYDIQNVIKKEEEKKQQEEKISDNTETEEDSVLGEKELTNTTIHEDKSDSTYSGQQIDDFRTIQSQTIEKEPVLNQPNEVSAQTQESTILQQKVSQFSLDATDPYYTPRTSPLEETRNQKSEYRQQCPTVEEETQSSLKGENSENQGGQSGDTDDNQHNSGEAVATEPCYSEEKKDKSSCCNEGDDRSDSFEKDDFYINVNKIISRVENVYNQLEEFETEMLMEEEQIKSPSLTTKNEPPEIRTPEDEAFLTPVMRAIEDLQQTSRSRPDSRKSNRGMNRSPSLYNVLSFLDTLADFKQERAVEIHMPRICYFAYVVHTAQTFRYASIQYQVKLELPPSASNRQLPPIVAEEPKKKTGCLKNSSIHSNVSSIMSRSKQKVSFLLEKEEKSTQVTACPFHSVARILNHRKTEHSTDTSSSSKIDQQVSAYLDARENKSVDKMSVPDDETTYQSTFEFSDEISSERTFQMPEQIVPNLQQTLENKQETVTNDETNVVELFKSNNNEENHPAGVKVFTEKDDWNVVKSASQIIDKEDITENSIEVVPEERGQTEVKVFYDNFKSEQGELNLKLICGFYNEDSIVQVQNNLSKDLTIKKRDSIEKMLKNNQEALLTDILKKPNLFEPLKNLNEFVDSQLLKEVVEKRQAIRMMKRRNSANNVSETSPRQGEQYEEANREVRVVKEGENENLLKGFYVFVYLLMFTALNLEYKCVQ